ncbi:FAD-containing oxidoreductase [Cupriavidus plantarum]|uniref:Pyruvate/2-oxoglutarate dehydrogenase complex dihydrolipoamide dehydrogenase (E3) component n=1 Tax=Cupriavidus plantarum TaxID=942865 RepID=A0A316EYZ7_9BURK|nr:FAD-containing oxidoreductase [Cupriavidus plantarum]PWK37466.1 pyruvate/2-oxoglutarate dehydrogenase complex dihydrolipoamide dehydrogenase (E3) component [Cupriavidus plantarum]
MTTPERFDAILIGTGQAAPALANRLSRAGMTVAVIERGDVGGTCVNVGCTPTKAMVASAYAARMTARAAEYGVMLDGKVRIDMAAVHARTQGIVMKSRNGVTRWIEGMRGAQLIRGHARFEDARTVRVGDRLLTADKIFLNVGGRALVPEAIRGLPGVPHLTNVEALALETVPRHLVVIGGSYIGLEFAQVFRRFGAEVTVVERGARLIAREDEEVSAQVRSILEAEGITIRTDANCITVRPHAEGVEVGVDCKSGEPAVVGSHVLVAVGRQPNTDDLGLDKAGIETDAHGYIVVDDGLKTNVEGVWALGDCNGRGAFTHTAYNDFEIVAANLLDGERRSVADRIPVYGLFIDPPLGRVGMTEAQARQAGHRVRIGKRLMTRVMRTVEKGESQGSMRVVVDADTDRILGAAILGVGGDEAVHSILSMMAADQPYTLLARTMAIHPTVAELIPTILGELGGTLLPTQ